MDLIADLKASQDKVTPEQLAEAPGLPAPRQFMIDFIMSENSMGFHAPRGAMCFLGDAINLCRLGQICLHGGPAPKRQPPRIAENASPDPQGRP